MKAPQAEIFNQESSINTTVQGDEQETVTNVQSESSTETSTAKVQNHSSSPAPKHIDLKHWKELVCDSGIDPEIASTNFKSLHQHGWQHQAWEYLIISPDISRRNDGRLTDSDLKRYSHIEKGGWWCDAGVEPGSFANLQPGEQPQRKLWGCYKPDEPRYKENTNKQKIFWQGQNKSSTPEKADKHSKLKKIKYEHPPKTNLSIFLLEVSDEIANKVYSKAGVNPNQSERQSGFWYCVWKHNIPITVTEGAKKTAAILSQGDAAIGLPGINAGYRSFDEQKNPIAPHLREEFAVFATPGREIKICFDYETKGKTKKSVFAAIAKTGKLLEAAEAKVSVVSLPGPEKGIDDLIVAHGTEAYQKVMAEALPLQEWQQQNPPPDLRLTIFLKDGTEINLYEKQADGKVTSNPANLDSAQVDNLTQKIQENSTISEPQKIVLDLEASINKNADGVQNSSFTISDVNSPTLRQGEVGRGQGEMTSHECREAKRNMGLSPPLLQSGSRTPTGKQATGEVESPSELSPLLRDPCSLASLSSTKTNLQKHWAEQRQVPNYAQNLPRSFLLQKENKEIALTAKKLIDQYGVQSDDGSFVYKSEAFSIRKFGEKISIHRAVDEKDSYFNFPLMQFEVSQKNQVKIVKPPFSMLSVERQEFLNVANNLSQGSELPSFYEDAITLKQNLGSLAPLGSQKVINNLQVSEVSQLLTTILETAGSKHLQIGDYRIKAENNQQTGKSSIKLIKKEKNGLEKVAVQIDATTNEAQIRKLSEGDINNLRLIAKRVQLEYSSSNQQQSNSYASPEYSNKYNTNSYPENNFVSTSKPKFQTKEKEQKQNRGYMGGDIEL